MFRVLKLKRPYLIADLVIQAIERLEAGRPMGDPLRLIICYGSDLCCKTCMASGEVWHNPSYHVHVHLAVKMPTSSKGCFPVPLWKPSSDALSCPTLPTSSQSNWHLEMLG